MKPIYQQQLIQLTAMIEDGIRFEADDEALEFAANRNAKMQLLAFLLHCHETCQENPATGEFNEVLHMALTMLSNYSGCAEDLEILEEILDILLENHLIDDAEYAAVIEKSAIHRWQ